MKDEDKTKAQLINELAQMLPRVTALEAAETERRQMEEALRHSEEQLRLITDALPALIAYIDSEQHYRFNNKAYEEWFGRPRTEITGKHLREVLGETAYQRIRKCYEAALSGREVTYEDVFPYKGGMERYITATYIPDFGAEGEVKGFFILANDITERKQAEELFRSLAMSSPVGVYIVQKGKFCYTNPQFQKDTGYREKELLGMESLSLVAPEDRETVRENAVQMLKGKRIAPYEYRTINKNGDVRWALEKVASVHYRGEWATVGSYHDITEGKKMEEQLIVTDRLASIGELASGIAHELNNPLTGVIGFSDLLLARDLPDDIREDLSVINREAQRAAGVVKGLLTFSRKHAPAKEPVNINDIIKTVLELRAYEQKINNIQVNTHFVPDLPEIMADGFQLQQVFINIIINAEYFMTEAHGRGTLTITTERVGEIIRVSFADDGPGIAEENLAHVFDPFFTTKEVGKGTGLGLSICHGIVTEHGGRIYARSKLGKGATFIAELPISK